ncbi:midnolin-like [Brienomyrus brachyistius]|uniref:midnolin-like n=1 Tax=Brienomyrus brachyistius TaxID=42636 RepID=UPI0020B1BD4C|nr:midnolin-like [Brienomyrus brachyistius]XP_048844672.1 midnolin-like [Brienomyrus brachyistius]
MDQHPTASSCTSRGAPSCEAVPSEPSMNVLIHSTTGTRFEVSLPLEETVEGLKRRLSQRLRVPKERLALLHKETRLHSGKLQDFGVSDGSRLTLVPTVEAGLMSQAPKPEQSIMQALESLTETQVSDFLSGRSPLTLALRVGDHMMFVQLQLAAQQSGGQQSTPQSQATHPPQLHPRGGAGATGGPGTSAGTFKIPHRSHSAAPPSALSSPASPTAPFGPAQSACLLPGSALHSHPHPASQRPPPAVACPEAANGSRCPPQSAAAAPRPRKPGAVIESFVSHAPGVFSGTFSGTLHPSCQDSSGHPRRDISTVLQILNDLLSATRQYQGTPPSLAHLRCQAGSSPPPSPTTLPASPTLAAPVGLATSLPPAATAPLYPLVKCQSQIRVCNPAGDRLRQTENRTMRCKVERLQLLMQQRRLRRKARRDSRSPYAWAPPAGGRKAGRSNSNSSSASSDASLDLDFDDAVWKPDVKADLSSEFMVA